LAVTLGAARLFAGRLDRQATSRGVPEALVGVLTALAADSPEISSALIALAKGAHGASFGVVVGSNVFNLAAMIGMTALLVGSVRLRREALLIEGLVGIVALLAAAAVLFAWVPGFVAAIVLAVVVCPYLALLLKGPDLLKRIRLHRNVIRGLERALVEREPSPRRPPTDRTPTRKVLALFVLDIAFIVAGSFGMVEAALSLGARLHVTGAVIGVVVLGPLTSLPNALTGIRLGLAHRGSALVSETLNSNTINLAAGVVLAALFVGVAGLSGIESIDLAWLGAATALCIALLARPVGMRRIGGAALVVSYAGFVVAQLALR
jgi:cation:H+ antiporter